MLSMLSWCFNMLPLLLLSHVISCVCFVSIYSMQYIFMILVLKVHGLFQTFFSCNTCLFPFLLCSLEVISIMVVWLIVNPCVLLNVSFLLFLSHGMHCVSFVCSQFCRLVARNPSQVKLFVCLLCVRCTACSQTFGILFLPIQTCAS